MKNNFENCLAEVLKHEGGYSDHPEDKGGATNYGVTQKVWEEWIGHPVTKDDMKNLVPSNVMGLYHNRYWDACKCDDLPAGVDYCVFDTAVNSGRVRAIKFLQAVVGTIPDGAIGPVTLASVNSRGSKLTIEQYSDKREAFLRGLSGFPTFGKGWLNRIKEVRATALGMANER